MNIVRLDGYGDFDMQYTKVILSGEKDPDEVFASFESVYVSSKRNPRYIEADWMNTSECLDELIAHFKENGYTEVHTNTYMVGD
jgi:hypothetical protein